MLSLIYVSRLAPSRHSVETIFRGILATARSRNEALNITGLLAYADGYFVQLLEGERAEVLQLYASITRDERHLDVSILSSTKITRRTHATWAMGGALLSNRPINMVLQLQQMRGKTVVFQTAVAVVCQESRFAQMDLAQVKVKFRDLSDAEIHHYLLAETPYDCAGSAKSEGLGIVLLESIDNDDPTALVGLPLIRTFRMIQAAGIQVL